MAIQAIRRSDRSFEVIVCETLTAGDVERIVDALARRPHGAVMIIDLRQARTCDPSALLTLTRVLEELPHVILGLTSADRRLLRYLEPTAGGSSPA